MHFWIFSYNRGAFLKNCVESVEHCAPDSKIHVFDDDSQDPETLGILATLALKYPVHFPAQPAAGSGKHGGLYSNMQTALDSMPEDAIVCFLQDDTQLVRPVQTDELDALATVFSDSRRAFVQPAFLRGYNRDTDDALTRFVADDNLYYVDRLQSSAGAWYSDIVITSVRTLRAVGWQFQAREPDNEQQARQHFEQMGYLRDPFVAWLPNVPAFRGRQQTRALRWAHKQRDSGFYPFEYLTPEQSGALRQRDPKILPYAEDFLALRNQIDLPKPWVYYPLQGIGWLKQLDRIERNARSLLSH